MLVGLSQSWESRTHSHVPALVGRTAVTDWNSEVSGSSLVPRCCSSTGVCSRVQLQVWGRQGKPQRLGTASSQSGPDALLTFPLLLLPAVLPAVCSSGFAVKLLLQQVVPRPFPSAGQVLLLVAWPEAGQLSAATEQRCSTALAAVEVGREPSSALPVCESDSNAFTSIPDVRQDPLSRERRAALSRFDEKRELLRAHGCAQTAGEVVVCC